MALRKDKGQDCIEVYIPAQDLCIEGVDLKPLDPNELGEYRVCDVEEDGEINWYLPEDLITSIVNDEDMQEIEEIAESFKFNQ